MAIWPSDFGRAGAARGCNEAIQLIPSVWFFITPRPSCPVLFSLSLLLLLCVCVCVRVCVRPFGFLKPPMKDLRRPHIRSSSGRRTGKTTSGRGLGRGGCGRIRRCFMRPPTRLYLVFTGFLYGLWAFSVSGPHQVGFVFWLCLLGFNRLLEGCTCFEAVWLNLSWT